LVNCIRHRNVINTGVRAAAESQLHVQTRVSEISFLATVMQVKLFASSGLTSLRRWFVSDLHTMLHTKVKEEARPELQLCTNVTLRMFNSMELNLFVFIA
jgi:hypothetical protein